MKRKDLIKRLENNGWWFHKEGGNHTKFTDGTHIEEIPRHKEIKETLAKTIIKRCNLK
jgi:mRNA interferase HicA